MQEATNTVQWADMAQKLLPYLGGGAAGALITLAATWYRNRRQPIGQIIETIEVFKKDPQLPSLQGVFSKVSDPKKEELSYDTIVISNLSMARITLVNKGNQDFVEFEVGVTLAEGDSVIDVRTETSDRHHVAEILSEVDMVKDQREIDFMLRPFNRRDKYTLNVYFTYEVPDQPIQLSTPHPVRFVEVGAMTQAALGMATEVVSKTTPVGAAISLIRLRDSTDSRSNRK